LEDEIASRCPEPLRKLASAAAKTVFISYKWCDIEQLGKQRFVLKFARELARAGMMVWLDKLALPGYASERRPLRKRGRQKSRETAQVRLRRSVALVALGTKNYG